MIDNLTDYKVYTFSLNWDIIKWKKRRKQGGEVYVFIRST